VEHCKALSVDAGRDSALQGGHSRAHVAVRGEQRRVQEVDAAGGTGAVPRPLLGVAGEELRDHVQQVLLLCMRIILLVINNNNQHPSELYQLCSTSYRCALQVLLCWT
jgi:hypothetical protein